MVDKYEEDSALDYDFDEVSPKLRRINTISVATRGYKYGATTKWCNS